MLVNEVLVLVFKNPLKTPLTFKLGGGGAPFAQTTGVTLWPMK